MSAQVPQPRKSPEEAFEEAAAAWLERTMAEAPQPSEEYMQRLYSRLGYGR